MCSWIWIFLLLGTGAASAQEPGLFNEDALRGLELRGIGPGLMSGRIADIAIHPSDDSTWYVAAGSGGVWKTVNRGTTWTAIFDGQSSYSIGCVTIDPNNPDVIWVGSGENVSGRHVGYGDGVYKSLDGGRTWSNMGLEASEHIGKILVDPRDSDVVLVAAEGPLWNSGGDRGVYRSEDGGQTWERALSISDETGATDLEFDPTDPDVVYAAAYQRRRKVWAHLAGGPESGIHKSTDGGKTWRELTTGLPSGDMGKIGLAVSPIQPEVVYATIEAHEKEAGFYRSEDSGESWEKRSSYLSDGTGPHYYQEIYASPHVFDRVYQMDVWMHVSDDGGRNFRRLGEPHKHSDNHALAFTDDPDYLLAGCDGGLYESYDGAASWKFISNLPITQIYKMAVDNAEPFYNIVGGTQDNGTLLGPSRTMSQHGILNRDWIVPYGADGYACAVDPRNPDLLYITWQRGNLLRYDRKTREPLDIRPVPGPGDPPERWNWDAPLLISPHSNTRIYFGSQRLWRSDDRGNSWRPVSGDLSRGQNRYEMPMIDTVPGVSALYDNGAMSWYGNTTTIDESPLREGLLYVGTDDGLLQVSEDGGENWRRAEIPDIPEGAFFQEVKASRHDADTVFAVLDNHKEGDFAPYLIKSTDCGRTWSSIVGDLPGRHILWSIEQDHVDPDLLFLGTEFGLFFTVDGGGHWVKLTGGIPTIALRDIVIQRRENDLVASTFGRGFYVLDDYTALRGLGEEALQAEARLFPVRDAIRYIPSVDLGVRGKGYQGGNYYQAPNPPFGAILTYYLREEEKTSREVREGREADMRKQGEDVPFPGWEALREERREQEPLLLITISDSDGNVVRRVNAPSGKGFHRVAWDLRYPSPEPTRLEEEEVPIWDTPPAGPLAAPGTYSAQLGRLSGGQLSPLGEPQSFRIKPLERRTLPSGDRQEILAFQQRTAELGRRAAAAVQKLEQAQRRLLFMRKALLDTPGADPALLLRLEGLRGRLADLDLELVGDAVKGRFNEPSKPTIADRIQQVAGGHWWTTEAPTETFRESLQVADSQFQQLSANLRQALQDLRALEDDLEEAGAPWTPGRRLPR